MRIAVPLAIPVALAIVLAIVLAVSNNHPATISQSALGACASPSTAGLFVRGRMGSIN